MLDPVVIGRNRPGGRATRDPADGGALPCSIACERNKAAILDVLRLELSATRSVLEIGSGTGQHAVFFARSLPQLVWQTSDLRDNHDAIRAWIAADGAPTVLPPVNLDVADREWPSGPFDAIFSANTTHIMSWPQVCAMFEGVGRVLPPSGVLLLYGPFAYEGRHTSQSNVDFDRMLRSRDPASGIRDVRDLDREAPVAGLHRSADHAMPANNRILVWRKE